MTRLDPRQLALDVFHGELHPGSAHLYARVSTDSDLNGAWEDGVRIHGAIDGPFCEGSSTLPAHLAFEDRGPGTALLAHVQLPDPCYWTPEVPLRYRVRIEIQKAAETIWHAEQMLGLRQLGLDSGRFQCAHQPWTLMGGELAGFRHGPPPAGMVGVMRGTDAGLLEAMSAGGGWCLTLLEQQHHREQLDLALRDCHAAANIGVILGGELSDFAPQAAPNLIRGQLFEADQDLRPAEWVDVAFVRFNDPAELARRTEKLDIPVVAVGTQSEDAGWKEIESSCQQLLGRLAAFRQFAGYIVLREISPGDRP